MIKLSLKNSAYPAPALHRWLLASVMLTVIAFGWKFPLLGFIVPVAMLGGMLGGLFRGRYVCGNLCPRGSFFDTLFAKFGFNRPIPQKMFAMPPRWAIMVVLMSVMSFRLAQNPGNINHWGLVFWQMCLMTTAAAVVLGIIFRPRSWCAICPVGSVGNAASGNKTVLTVAENCRSCNLCEKNCPMGHSISAFKRTGLMTNRDCLQCATCVHVCPVSALQLRKASAILPAAIQPPQAKNLRKAA